MVSSPATEVVDLAGRYGQPVHYTTAINSPAFWEDRNRTAEVCMVICRPSGLLLAFRKDFYPPQTFRLPTGGVEEGEGIEAALRREVHEETGLDIEIARFLAVVGYRPAGAPEDVLPVFQTYAFLLKETGGTLAALDEDERVEEFQEIAPFELLALADHLEKLPETEADGLGESWAEWGRFRGVAHRVVYEALSAPTP